MAKFSHDDISRVLSGVNIVEHISKSVKLTRKSNDYLGLCPFHQEKTPSFTVSDKKQFFYCFGCHKHGNVIDYVMSHQQLNFPEAVSYLAELNHITLDQSQTDNTNSANEKKNTLKINNKAYEFYRQQLSKHPHAQLYLKNRSINDKTIKAFGIGFAPDEWQGLLKYTQEKDKKIIYECGLFAVKNNRTYDRMRNRIIFPIYDLKKQCIGFGGRVISDDQQPKYLNSPDTPVFHKSHVLYGLSQCIDNKDLESLLVVEGYMDVIMLHQHGVTCAVASLGTAFTSSHLKLLQRYAQKDIVFCFDGDNAGQRAMQKAIDIILAHIDDRHRFKFLSLPDKADPDSTVSSKGGDHFKQLIKDAQPLENALEERWRKGLDQSLLQDQAYFLKRAQDDLKSCKDSFFKQLIIKNISIKYPVKPKPTTIVNKDITHSPKRQPVSGWVECLSCLIEKPTEIKNFIDELETIKTALPESLVVTLTHLHQYSQNSNKAMLLESTRENEDVHSWVASALKLSEPQNPVKFIDSYMIYLKKRVLEKRIDSLMNLPEMNDTQKKMLQKFIALKHAIKKHSR